MEDLTDKIIVKLLEIDAKMGTLATKDDLRRCGQLLETRLAKLEQQVAV